MNTKPDTQPNLLIVIADQLAAQALPDWGHKIVYAPEISRLAAEGVRFGSAYAASPLCGPARAGLMTGRRPSATGVFDNACEWPAGQPSFGHYLRRAGYQTSLCGKMHFVGPDQLHGFEERLTTDIYPADFGWTPDWTQPDARPSWYHSMDSVLHAGPCARSNQIDFDEEAMHAARRKLFDLARSKDRRPFCLVVSLTHPHDPFNITPPFWNLYADAEIDLVRIPAGVSDDPHSRRLRRACGLDEAAPAKAQVRAARRAYYGAISFVDAQLGVLRRTLAETGLAQDTVTVFTSDHGELLGEHGLWYKMSFFEQACRVPLIVHAPGRFAPRVVEEPVSLLDLVPTLCALGGAGAPLETDGASLVPWLAGEAGCEAGGGTGHDGAIGEYCAEIALAPMVMIRRGRWKFIHSPADPDQLFDLAADPDETRNLAPDAPGVLEAFRAEVARRWDLPALHGAVLESQRRRALVAEALAIGRRTAWDYAPPANADTAYVRPHKKLESIEHDARLPVLDAAGLDAAGLGEPLPDAPRLGTALPDASLPGTSA